MSQGLGALKYIASQDADLTALVADRIFPLVADYGCDHPFGVLTSVSRIESPTQDEDSAVDTERIQVDFFAKNTSAGSGYKLASKAFNLFRDAVKRWTGEIHTDDFDVLVDGVQSSGGFDGYDHDTKLYRVSGDFMVRVKYLAPEEVPVILLEKVTMTYDQFTSETQESPQVPVFTLPGVCMVHAIMWTATESFTESTDFEIGTAADVAYFIDRKEAIVTFWRKVKEYTFFKIDPLTDSTVVMAKASGVGFLNLLESGSIDIYIYYSILE